MNCRKPATSVPLPRERFWDVQVAKIDSPTRQPLCPGRPASVPLRHTIARSALATQHSRKWLDGVSDALAYALRWPGTYRPQATTAIRPRLRLPGTTRPRFALHGAKRSKHENCFVLEDNTVQPFVKIGNNVTLWSGNHIGHHSVIGDNTFITSHVVISGGVDVGRNCFIGVNATVHDHVRLADYTLVGAASLINKDTEPYGVYIGIPAEKSRVPSNRLKL
jgi:acetyltransferase-like isoleucine patch superfamily enzyme